MTKPWLTEKNLEKGHIYGYDYVIARNPLFGHLCGYVRIGSNNQLWREGFPNFNQVHGNITWTEDSLPFWCTQGAKDEWWIGFDCGHWCDFRPKDINQYSSPNNYRTWEFVEGEILKLIEVVSKFEK